jgi:hypothetical protein
MAAFAAVGYPPDLNAALFAESLDAPHKLIASHTFECRTKMSYVQGM